MSNRTIIDNSIWVNGIQKDSEGYAVFYPLGTNKVDIPKNSPHWPKGNKLIGRLVYKDDKLVGFCDTKAMTSNNNGEIIVMPYEYIDTKFDSIEKDSIQIHAPKATVKKASWKDSRKVDIPDVQYKYKGCKNVNAIKTKDENYLENDIVDGKWTELLSDLNYSNQMFKDCENLTIFTSDLSSLTGANHMFQDCSNLITFESDLSSLVDSYQMFQNCVNLTTFKSILGSVVNCHWMFCNCPNLISFNCDLKTLKDGRSMFERCSSLVSFESDLSSLTNARNMFMSCSNLITFNCADLSSLEDGWYMFSGTKITSFDYNLKSLSIGTGMFKDCANLVSFNCNELDALTNGGNMFNGCSSLTKFTSDLKTLTNGGSMFLNCTNLTSFESDLSSLKGGNRMFSGCSNLVTFKSNLKSITIGSGMFDSCSNLTSFDINLSSLTTADLMFHNCYNLKSFTSDLKLLTNGNSLFQNCSNLTSFNANLSSLETAQYIFYGCKLDATSIKNVIDTINKNDSSKLLSIGMGCDNNITDKNLFAQEVGYSNMTSLLAALQNKGWTVSAQFNGRPSSNYSLRQPESLPIYAKLVEIIPSEEDDYIHYEYTSADETKFFNLDWFHETTGSTDGYTQFNSIQEAISTFNIKQIEK